jgi:hypothetical protein
VLGRTRCELRELAKVLEIERNCAAHLGAVAQRFIYLKRLGCRIPPYGLNREQLLLDARAMRLRDVLHVGAAAGHEAGRTEQPAHASGI